MAAPGFVRSISANLAYWHGRVDACGDPAACDLLPEGQNMYRAVEFGLALPETWTAAAELILALAYYVEHGGSWRTWQLLLRKAIERCAEKEADLKLRLLNHSGHYYRLDRDWEAALAAHREEELLAREPGREAHLAQTYLSLGMLFWRQRAYEEAAHYSQQALAGFQELGATDRQMGGVLTNLGLIDYGRGNYEAATEAHGQAVAHFRKTDFTVLLARSLVNLALAQEGNGDVEAAMATYFEARSILDQSDYEMDKARLELSLGTLLFNTKRFDEAEEAWLRAYSPYLKRSGLIYYQGLATNNLGNVYLEQGRLNEAEAMLRESLALWERANAQLQLANTIGSLGKVLAAQGRSPEAMACFEAAISGAECFSEDDYGRQIAEEFRLERAEPSLADKKSGQAAK